MKSNSARTYILNFSWKKKQKYSASDLVEICDETKVADNRYQYHSCSHINTYFCILGILVSFEIVCTAPDSEMVGSVENDKFELYTTNIFSVSGRDFLSLPKEMRTLKVCCETI